MKPGLYWRPLLRREPVLALSFPLRSWTLSCKVSLLNAVAASPHLAFAFFFALALALALSFATADIVRCGLLSFLLYFSLFLRIRFTHSAQPPLVRVIPPKALCTHKLAPLGRCDPHCLPTELSFPIVFRFC